MAISSSCRHSRAHSITSSCVGVLQTMKDLPRAWHVLAGASARRTMHVGVYRRWLVLIAAAPETVATEGSRRRPAGSARFARSARDAEFAGVLTNLSRTGIHTLSEVRDLVPCPTSSSIRWRNCRRSSAVPLECSASTCPSLQQRIQARWPGVTCRCHLSPGGAGSKRFAGSLFTFDFWLYKPAV